MPAVIPQDGSRAIGFAVSIVVATLSLSSAYLWGSNGMALATFAAATVGWTGYLFAHYFCVGEFMDGVPEAKRPTTPTQLGVFLLGSGILVTGIIVGSVGVRGDVAYITHGGATLFTTGYMAAHYAATGTLL
ncbi:MAG: hypothetical protein ABEI97_01285 [Candidatus Nanohaloarchaea archaeon]